MESGSERTGRHGPGRLQRHDAFDVRVGLGRIAFRGRSSAGTTGQRRRGGEIGRRDSEAIRACTSSGGS
jgi:hypothetical protein